MKIIRDRIIHLGLLKSSMLIIMVVSAILLIFVINGCSQKPGGDVKNTGELARIEPDYTDITIPQNIAPLNFIIKEDASAYFVSFTGDSGKAIEVTSKDGIIRIPEKKWSGLLKENYDKELRIDIYTRDCDGNWSKFNTITNMVSGDPIDPFLSYRLLYPGYEAYTDLYIKQRSMSSFDEHSLVENTILDENCINCHSFNPKSQEDFLFHVRGALGGTYFFHGGTLRKLNLKTSDMQYNATYPRWHPSGKYIAFSSNRTIQFFHSSDPKKVEVADLASSLILYDIGGNKVSQVNVAEKAEHMDTYPEWSPDGNFLYFCRADQVGQETSYQDIRYNLCRMPFNQEDGSFGAMEIIYDAASMNRSVSFPRISPDGKYLVINLHDYGCFPIWHKDADLYVIDLGSMIPSRLDLNSTRSESYHSWSSNNRWMVFSSKRGDGLTARPYIAFIDGEGKSRKPFILPQKNPEFYNNCLKTFNIPELSQNRISLSPGEIRKTALSTEVKAN